MANTFRKVYKKTGNSGTSSDYQLVGNIGVNGVELNIMKGASSSISGEIGLVPKPTAGEENCILTGDGVWNQFDNILEKSQKFISIENIVVNTPLIRAGSVVLKNTSSSYIKRYTIFSNNDLKNIFGLDTNVELHHANTTVIFMNGDTVASPNDDYFSEYHPSYGWGVYFLNKGIEAGADVRFNYIAAYFGKMN